MLTVVLMLLSTASPIIGGPSRVTADDKGTAQVVLIKDGKPQMPIISGSVAEPVVELRQ